MYTLGAQRIFNRLQRIVENKQRNGFVGKPSKNENFDCLLKIFMQNKNFENSANKFGNVSKNVVSFIDV